MSDKKSPVKSTTEQEKPNLDEVEPQISKKQKVGQETEKVVTQTPVKEENEIQAVLLDIEGTTTPITFVTDILFPYARKQMKAFILENFENESVKKELLEIVKEAKKQKDIEISEIPKEKSELEKEGQEFLPKILDFINFLMDENQKLTPLKSIQGKIWESAYKSKEILGTVYDDVEPEIKKWIEQGIKVYIYSSGSVPAQKLLFGFSDKGDMTKHFSGYYDTKIGLKIEKQSYVNILEDIKFEGKQCVFVTDRFQEAEAADQAGIKVFLSVRDGTEKLPDQHKFTTVTSFDKIKL